MPKRNTFNTLVLAGLVSIPAVSQGQTQTSPAVSATKLNELVVTATRNMAAADEMSQKTTIISREQIEQQLAITSDPGQVLANLIPSYSPSRQKLSNAGETFRGRSPLFLIDGVPQSNPLRDSARDSYTIDLSMVERIEVIHGASAEHGLGATGGIINFVTRKAESGQVNQSVSASVTSDDDVDSDGQGYKLNYRLSGQSGNWEYVGGATYQQRGVFYDGEDDIVGIAYPGEIQNSDSHDILAKIGYWLDDHQNIEFFINRFKLEGNGDYEPVQGNRENGVPTKARPGNPDGEPGYNEVTTARLSYTHDDWLGNRVDTQLYRQSFRAQFATTTYFPYKDGNGDTQFDQTRNESDKLGGKFTLTRQGLFDNHLTLTTGLDLLQDDTKQMLIETNRTYVPESRFRNLAAFLQANVNVTDRLSVNGGVRHERAKLKVDTYTTVDRSNVTQDNVVVDGGNPDFNETLYNAGVVLQVTDWAQVYGNYSEGFGMPDVGRVLRGISKPDQDVDSLIQLQPIVTDNREVGTRINWETYRLEVSYYESSSDLGERLTERNGVWVGSREKTEIKGWEVSAEADINPRHQLGFSYSYVKGKSDADGDGRVDKELTGLNVPPETIRATWSAGWTQALSSHLQYSHFLDRDVEGNTLDFDGYGLFDASVAYQTSAGKLSLGIENLLDKTYITYYSQAARASKDYYFRGRGRTITLGYQQDF